MADQLTSQVKLLLPYHRMHARLDKEQHIAGSHESKRPFSPPRSHC
jgi:hypothetical protein